VKTALSLKTADSNTVHAKAQVRTPSQDRRTTTKRQLLQVSFRQALPYRRPPRQHGPPASPMDRTRKGVQAEEIHIVITRHRAYSQTGWSPRPAWFQSEIHPCFLASTVHGDRPRARFGLKFQDKRVSWRWWRGP